MKKIILLIAGITVANIAKAQTPILKCVPNEYIHINLANNTPASNHLRIDQCSRDVKQGREISYSNFPVEATQTGKMEFKDNFSDHPEVLAMCALVDIDPRTASKTTVGYLEMYADNPCTGINTFRTTLLDPSGLIYPDAPWIINYSTNGDRSLDWSINVEIKAK
jgi:hypothetical protein